MMESWAGPAAVKQRSFFSWSAVLGSHQSCPLLWRENPSILVSSVQKKRQHFVRQTLVSPRCTLPFFPCKLNWCSLFVMKEAWLSHQQELEDEAGPMMTFQAFWRPLAVCSWSGLTWMSRPGHVGSWFKFPPLVDYWPNSFNGWFQILLRSFLNPSTDSSPATTVFLNPSCSSVTLTIMLTLPSAVLFFHMTDYVVTNYFLFTGQELKVRLRRKLKRSKLQSAFAVTLFVSAFLLFCLRRQSFFFPRSFFFNVLTTFLACFTFHSILLWNEAILWPKKQHER